VKKKFFVHPERDFQDLFSHIAVKEMTI